MKRTATTIAVAVLTAPLLLTACSESGSESPGDTSTSTESLGRAGIVTPAESSSWRGDLAIGVGDQQTDTLITLPAPKQVEATCIGEGDSLTVNIVAPNGWHAVLTHGSQTVTVDNTRLNYPAQEFTTPQSSLDYDVAWNKKFGTTDQFLSGVTWDIPQTGDIEIQLNERTPPHWVVKSAEKVNLAMHISCGTK